MEDYSGDLQTGRIVQTGPNVFKADDQIIKSAAAARTLYYKLRSNHLKRILFYTDVEGLLQGNPPFDPRQMAAAGLQHVANFNDMSPRAIYERFCQAYWNLLYNSQAITNFILRLPDPQAPDWAAAMARNFDIAIKNHWPSFHVNVSSMIAQLVKFGISPIIFPDERSPVWRVVELSKFFVPDQAQSDLDLLTTACVENEFTVQYLWQVYQEFKDKPFGEKTPWNARQIGHLLLQVANRPIKEAGLGPQDLFELERKTLSGDISFDRMYNDSIRVISLFQTEFGGKVSHYMFHRVLENNSAQNPNQPGDEFLFYQNAQYEEMSEGIILFTLTPGEYTIHANRGLGHKIYSLAQASIMMDCSLVDGGRWASTPIIKSSSLNAHDVNQIRFIPGVPTDIGGADFVQNNLGSNLQHIIGVAQYLKNQMQFNLTYSGSDPGSPDADKGSLNPVQSKLGAFREFNVLKNGVLHFYNTFDRVIQLMVEKMGRAGESDPKYAMAKEWRELCLADGVPPQVFELFKKPKRGLPQQIQVSATRVAGAGSQVALLLGLEAMNPILGSFTEDEQREYKKLYVSAAIGPEYIDTFAQKPKPDESRGGSSLAGVENAIIQMGKSPIFSQDNEHRSHWITHFALLNQTMQAVEQQQMDVVEADKIFSVGFPHEQQHFEALVINPFAQDFVGQVKPYMVELEKFVNLNRQNAERSMEAQQKQQQEAAENQDRVMSEEELKNFQAQQNERRSDMKLQAQTVRQERAGAAKEQALAQKTVADITLKAATVKSDHIIGLKELEAENMRELMKPEKPDPGTNGKEKPSSK